MKNFLFPISFVFFTTLQTLSFAAQPWHFPLYLDGGNPCSKRVELKIENTNDYDVDGGQIKIGADVLGIAGTQAKSLRIVGENGRELLFNISNSSDILSESSTVSIPINCPAKSETKLWIYFDNPSAWKLPASIDVKNSSAFDSFEDPQAAETDVPQGWISASTSPLHINLWCKDTARTGSRSLKTVVLEGGEQRWIAFFRRFQVPRGASYKISGWVKGENVAQRAGFYIHQGSPDRGIHKDSNSGTFDWRQVVFQGTLPYEAEYLQFGTVMYSTSGTAWYDDIEFTIEGVVPGISYTVSQAEECEFSIIAAAKSWELDKSLWPSRITCSAVNLADYPSEAALCSIPITRLANGYFDAEDYKILIDGAETPFLLVGEKLLIPVGGVPAKSIKQFNVYLRSGRKNMKFSAVLGQSSSILSDYEIVSQLPSNLDAYEDILNSPANLLKNPSFETPSDWKVSNDGANILAYYSSDDAKFGSRCAQLRFINGSGWFGFRQGIPVQQNKSYVILGWSKAVDEDINGNAYAHLALPDSSFTGFSTKISSSKEWRMFMIDGISNPYPSAELQVHLTSTFGHWQYDGIILAEILPMGPFSHASASDESEDGKSASGELKIWQVPSIVKVFPSTEYSGSSQFRLDMAANEYENLQIALRCGEGKSNICVSATPAFPINPETAATSGLPEQSSVIPEPQIGVVGCVKIDATSNYFNFSDYKSYESCIPPSSLGVMYPDPILPISAFDLKASETSAVHLTFKTPKDIKSGLYSGNIEIRIGGELLTSIPYYINVWDFCLADSAPISAVFDFRTYSGSQYKNYSTRAVAEFLAERKLSPDIVPVDPKIYVDSSGNVSADFSEFEIEAQYYIEELKFPRLYMNGSVKFGWGNPPDNYLGARPYEGNYPYDNVDRYNLSPEFKKRAQQSARLRMDFLRSKGWQDRFLEYICDEPFYSDPKIIAQMNGLCDMLHEAEPDMKIYVSTWYHIPEWDGKIDVWGIGVQGQVDETTLEEISKSSEAITTTDGQMCLDTPYNAIERLLPLFCFKYKISGYEFWGVDWYTWDPLEWGTHSVISQTETPGNVKRTRYPNGDGYILYPGKKYGLDTPIPSVRSEALRDGVEDYEYYAKLEELVLKTKDTQAAETLKKIKEYVSIPNAGGRNSTYIMPDPNEFLELRNAAGAHIDRLVKSLRGDLGYKAWINASMPDLDESSSAASASPMNDGITNLEKFAFGLSPETSASGEDRRILKIKDGMLTLKGRKSANIIPQSSSDMKNWKNISEVEIVPLDSTYNTYKLNLPKGEPQKFYRILIEE